ncbi:MAG: hypothetical protein AB8G11_16280 [Saprospiraceae bacterium]
MDIFFKTLGFFVLFFVITSFSFVASTNSFVGTYGVTNNNPNVIELTLNEDFSFIYKDFSNPKKKIDIQGKWKVENETIFLKEESSSFSFHNKWKIEKNGKVAKSRKGMTFYTLMKL